MSKNILDLPEEEQISLYTEAAEKSSQAQVKMMAELLCPYCGHMTIWDIEACPMKPAKPSRSH